MGFWDKLFGTSRDEETPQPPRPEPRPERRPEPEVTHAAEPAPATEERYTPAPSEDRESLTDVIRRTPAVPMPGSTAASQSAPDARDERAEHFRITDAHAAESRDAVAAATPESYSARIVDSAEPVAREPEPSYADEVEPEVPEAAFTHEDEATLADILELLDGAAIHRDRDITLADVAAAKPAGMEAFRSRPLTTVLELVDGDGQPLLSPVHLDVEQHSRTTPEELRDYAEDLAAFAGTAADLRVTIMRDPGSDRSGSMAIQAGYSVRDVQFDLDPDFGDQEAEAALVSAVSAEGRVAHAVATGDEGERLTVWASKLAPRGFFATIDDENRH